MKVPERPVRSQISLVGPPLFVVGIVIGADIPAGLANPVGLITTAIFNGPGYFGKTKFRVRLPEPIGT
jgi:hypothetical protein